MLAAINPVALPALRIAATFFLLINLLGGTYIFLNRHRFFDGGPNVDNDIPAVRKLRIEGRCAPLAGSNHASRHSSYQSLARVIRPRVRSPLTVRV
jgi:hypothetical protein